MHATIRAALGAVLLWGATPPMARAGGYTFATVAVPGATQTDFAALNALGDVAGFWVDQNQVQHGFLASGGTLTTIDVAGATATSTTGINSARTIIGYDIDRKRHVHGFSWSNGVFTNRDLPGSIFTEPLRINDAGDIAGVTISAAGTTLSFIEHAGLVTQFPVGASTSFITALNVRGTAIGHYDDAKGAQQGFVRRGGQVHRLAVPNADLMELTALNDSGSFVGYFHSTVAPSPNLTGFVQKGQTRRLIRHPGTKVTQVSGINAAGLIVGYFAPAGSQTLHSFLYDGARFTAVDPPHATESDAEAINNAGQIAGNFAAGSGLQVFVATPK